MAVTTKSRGRGRAAARAASRKRRHVRVRKKVTGNAASFGGEIRVAPGAKIAGDRLQLSDRVQVRSENGKDLDLSVSVAGHDLSRLLVAKLVEKARNCRIEAVSAGSGEIRL